MEAIQGSFGGLFGDPVKKCELVFSLKENTSWRGLEGVSLTPFLMTF